MRVDFSTLRPADRYKLLTGVIVPRPIAFVTSVDEEGRVNAAPFSFFNAMGSDPPIVAIGIVERAPGVEKDTIRNLRASREFVVNLVSEELLEQVNVCAADFPPGEEELSAAGLGTRAAHAVRPPLVAQAPVSLECRLHSLLEIGNNRVVIGEVLHLHAFDGLIDAERWRVRGDLLRTLGRMGGPGGYMRTTDRFDLPRISYAEWLERSADQARE